MLMQQQMICKVRQICSADKKLVAAFMYGSFAKGTGDEYSDIEFVLYFSDNELAKVDRRAWIEQIDSVELCFNNEFGITTAIFSSLIRGEFHFEKASDIPTVRTWKESDWFPSLGATLIVDKTGELTPYLLELVGEPPDNRTPERLQFVANSFLNWMVFGVTVLHRGEYARSLDILSWVQRNLLWMSRAISAGIANWPTPSKSLEQDLTPIAYSRYVQCTAGLDRTALNQAYYNCLLWGVEMLRQLTPDYKLVLPEELVMRLEELFLSKSTAPWGVREYQSLG